MADYDKLLNRDRDLVRTPARHDDGVGGWVQDVALWTKNGAGVLVPVSPTDPAPVSVSGSRISETPTVGSKTFTTSPALVQVGASPLANRKYILVYNPGPAAMRFGGASINTTTGMRVMPDDYYRRDFEPGASVEVYACTESGSISGDVEEGK